MKSLPITVSYQVKSSKGVINVLLQLGCPREQKLPSLILNFDYIGQKNPVKLQAQSVTAKVHKAFYDPMHC